jgi:hypothetical protein
MCFHIFQAASHQEICDYCAGGICVVVVKRSITCAAALKATFDKAGDLEELVEHIPVSEEEWQQVQIKKKQIASMKLCDITRCTCLSSLSFGSAAFLNLFLQGCSDVFFSNEEDEDPGAKNVQNQAH